MSQFYLSVIAMLLLGCVSVSTVFAVNVKKTIIITATRTAQTADESLASVTVITRKDIERQQARSMQDLLRGVVGINIVNNGGPGKSTSILMRGTESDHVLILIDGIRVGSATVGGVSYENIPIDQIDRIEIVRGPRASLYGAGAIGGVIQIFTRKGGGDLKPSFSFGGGSYRTFNGSIGLSGGNRRGWFNINASGIGTDGFNSCNGRLDAGCFAIPDSGKKPDRDGYRNVAGSFRAGYRFDNGVDIATNFLHSDGKTKFDGSFVNKSEITQQVFGATMRYSPIDSWQVNVIAGRSREDSDNFIGNIFRSSFNTRRDSVSLLNNFTLGKGQLLTAGFDYQNDHISSNEDFTVTSRHNFGIFTQHQAVIAAHDLQASVRYDRNEQFGNRVTGGVGWGYAFSNKLRLTANFGTAFKAPTFNELYFPNFGNANLRPEKSRSFEFGVNGKAGWGNWSLNGYETRITDLVAFDTSIFAPNNIDETRILGLEGVLDIEVRNWHINTNVTLLDPVNNSSGANDGNLLPRRARQSFHLDANRQFGKFVVGTALLAEGSRYDDLANTRKLDSYVKVDLRAEYIITQNWRLQGRIENLFDKQYETASFFNQPGRNFFATVRYQPSR